MRLGVMTQGSIARWSALVMVGALTAGCATTGYRGARSFTDEEASALAGCQYEAAAGGHVWRCEAGRLLDARVESALTDAATARDRVGAVHPNLARPEFMKSDASTLDGEAVTFSMLGYSDGLAILITEAASDRGRAVVCLVPGDPQRVVDDVARWCKVRIGAIWRTL